MASQQLRKPVRKDAEDVVGLTRLLAIHVLTSVDSPGDCCELQDKYQSSLCEDSPENIPVSSPGDGCDDRGEGLGLSPRE